MHRLSTLAILICTVLVLDQVFFRGYYRDTAWDEMSYGVHFINHAVVNVMDRVNR